MDIKEALASSLPKAQRPLSPAHHALLRLVAQRIVVAYEAELSTTATEATVGEDLIYE